jgi:hypothetical protein
VLVDARCAVGAEAVTQGHPAQLKVLLELDPLVRGDVAVLGQVAQGPPARDELLVAGDDLFLEHRGVATGGVQVEVAEQRRDDVQRQTRAEGLGAEQPPEVVRREPDRAVAVT